MSRDSRDAIVRSSPSALNRPSSMATSTSRLLNADTGSIVIFIAVPLPSWVPVGDPTRRITPSWQIRTVLLRSALLRRLHHETRELRHDLRVVALGTFRLTLLPLRDGHDQFERLVALLAYELVARHGDPSFFPAHPGRRASTRKSWNVSTPSTILRPPPSRAPARTDWSIPSASGRRHTRAVASASPRRRRPASALRFLPWSSRPPRTRP